METYQFLSTSRTNQWREIRSLRPSKLLRYLQVTMHTMPTSTNTAALARSSRSWLLMVSCSDLLFRELIFTLPVGHFPGASLCRPQSPGPDLDLVARWLKYCLDNHPQCQNGNSNWGPTRLLKILPRGEPGMYDLRLMNNNNRTQRYVALSHCGGKDAFRPLRTTSETYAAHQNRIPFEALPKSFQDAILVTVRLGVNRLWIDSLCIIQDDKSDWERECPLMASVYSESFITVSASSAANAHVGFLRDYSGRADLGNSVSIRLLRTTDPSWTMAEDEPSFLSTRGWTLQEAAFSRRLIAFKEDRMQWHCSVLSHSDDIKIPYYQGGELPRSAAASKLASTRIDGYRFWRETAQRFSEMELTVSSDKLPALSGVAKFLSDKLNDTYVAGGTACVGMSRNRIRLHPRRRLHAPRAIEPPPGHGLR